MNNWLEQAKTVQAEVTAWRHEFHRHPELSFREQRTTARVAELLRQMGYTDVRIGVPRAPQCGVVAEVNPGKPGRCILLRADMDALPIQEQTGLAYASQVPNVMHACGHDAHIAMLLGAAKLLHSVRDRLNGNVRLLFQPCEEYVLSDDCPKSGAQLLVEEGDVLNGVDAALALHVWGTLPSGTVCYAPGPFMTANMTVTMQVCGVGGHGAMPQSCVDPVVAACQIVTAWQSIVSREIAPSDTAVVTVGGMNVDDAAYNIIPDRVTVLAGIRAYSDEQLWYIARRMHEIADGVAQGLRCSIRFETTYGGPPVVNDPALTQRAAEAIRRAVGEAHVRQIVPIMPSEDFAWYQTRVPGAMLLLGVGDAEKGTDYPQHHCRFNSDDDALPIGVAALAAAACDLLQA